MTRTADRLRVGDAVHVTDHDVYCGEDHPVYHTHVNADVTITGVDRCGCIVVIAGLTTDGAWTATSYDADAPVEVTS